FREGSSGSRRYLHIRNKFIGIIAKNIYYLHENRICSWILVFVGNLRVELWFLLRPIVLSHVMERIAFVVEVGGPEIYVRSEILDRRSYICGHKFGICYVELTNRDGDLPSLYLMCSIKIV